MRYLGYGSAATAAAAFLALWLTGSSAVALDDVYARVEKAESVRFVTEEFSDGKSMNTQTVVSRGNQVRIEGKDHPLEFVIDHDLKGAIILDSRTKTYQTIDLTKAGILPTDAFNVNLKAQVQELKKQKAEYAGAEKADGLLLDKYTVTGAAALGHRSADWSLWIDRKTKLPVKMASEYKQELRGAKMDGTPFAEDHVITRVYESFEWNPKIEKGLFSLDPPAGYTEGTIFTTIPPLTPYKKK
jgi:hypothetical protein